MCIVCESVNVCAFGPRGWMLAGGHPPSHFVRRRFSKEGGSQSKRQCVFANDAALGFGSLFCRDWVARALRIGDGPVPQILHQIVEVVRPRPSAGQLFRYLCESPAFFLYVASFRARALTLVGLCLSRGCFTIPS